MKNCRVSCTFFHSYKLLTWDSRHSPIDFDFQIHQKAKILQLNKKKLKTRNSKKIKSKLNWKSSELMSIAFQVQNQVYFVSSIHSFSLILCFQKGFFVCLINLKYRSFLLHRFLFSLWEVREFFSFFLKLKLNEAFVNLTKIFKFWWRFSNFYEDFKILTKIFKFCRRLLKIS